MEGQRTVLEIYGAIDLTDPDITLTAGIYLSTSGVVLEMTMSGCWENAFGASWLDICSIQSSVAMISWSDTDWSFLWCRSSHWR